MTNAVLYIVEYAIVKCSAALAASHQIPTKLLKAAVDVISPFLTEQFNRSLSGIPGHLVQHLQSVMNAATKMICLTSRYSHITSIQRQLHWLKARERTDFKLAVLVYKCLHGTGPAYLADELRHSSEFVSSRRLRSASSLNLIVRQTRLSTYGDRAFSVAGPRVWNSLSPHVTSALSVNIFKTRLK